MATTANLDGGAAVVIPPEGQGSNGEERLMAGIERALRAPEVIDCLIHYGRGGRAAWWAGPVSFPFSFPFSPIFLPSFSAVSLVLLDWYGITSPCRCLGIA